MSAANEREGEHTCMHMVEGEHRHWAEGRDKVVLRTGRMSTARPY